jgi:hypothetical protein
MTSWTTDYLTDVDTEYRGQKAMADAALARCDDVAFFARLPAAGDDATAEHTNSIAILVKHLAGNLRSRWTDLLTTDGEKPDRHRDLEFIDEPGDERGAILARWEAAWRILFATLDALTAEDLGRTITIRGEPHSVLQAIQRNLLHTAHHIGQIDLLASADLGGAGRAGEIG